LGIVGGEACVRDVPVVGCHDFDLDFDFGECLMMMRTLMVWSVVE